MGQGHHCLDWIGLFTIDDIRGADLLCQFQLAVVEIDRDHPRAERRSDLNRRQSNSAASIDHYRLIGLDLALIENCMKRGDKAAPHSGSLDKIYLVGKWRKVEIGMTKNAVASVTPHASAQAV